MAFFLLNMDFFKIVSLKFCTRYIYVYIYLEKKYTHIYINIDISDFGYLNRSISF